MSLLFNHVDVFSCLDIKFSVLSWCSGCLHSDYINDSNTEIFIFMDYMSLLYFIKANSEFAHKNISIICNEKIWSYSWLIIEEELLQQNYYNHEIIQEQWQMKLINVVDGQNFTFKSASGDLNIGFSQNNYFISCGSSPFFSFSCNKDYSTEKYPDNFTLTSYLSSYPDIVLKIMNSSKKFNIINSNSSGHIFKIIEELILKQSSHKFVIFSPIARKSFVSHCLMSGYSSDSSSKTEHIFSSLIENGTIILITDLKTLISSKIEKSNSKVLFFASNSWIEYSKKYLSYNNITFDYFNSIFNLEEQKFLKYTLNSTTSTFLLPIHISPLISSKIFPDQDSIHTIKNTVLKKEENSKFTLYPTKTTSVTKSHYKTLRSPFYTIDALRANKIYTIKILKNTSPSNWSILLPQYETMISTTNESEISITSTSATKSAIYLELRDILSNVFDETVSISY